jgi:hypothetical protein
MQSNFFGFAANSFSAAILHLIPFVAIGTTLVALVIRMSAPATARVKVKTRRGPERRRVRKKQYLTVLEIPRRTPKQNAQFKPELLSEGVLRFLEEAETREGSREIHGAPNENGVPTETQPERARPVCQQIEFRRSKLV